MKQSKKNLSFNKTLIFIVICLTLITSSDKTFSQTVNSEFKKSSGKPSQHESFKHTNYSGENNQHDDPDKELKSAIESGDNSKADKLRNEINSNIKEENKFVPKDNNEIVFLNNNSGGQGTDWLEYGKLLHSGKVKDSSDFYRQIDMKTGDDGFMYASVNCNADSVYKGRVNIYRSTDNGKKWNFLSGFAYPFSFIGNISMLVESKNNLNPDSTRVIIFYTKSNLSNNFYSTLNFFSSRVNGSSNSSKEITSPHGGKFTFLSAVTDGAFYSSATYFGVVCAETDNNLSHVISLRFFRTIDWGETWTGTSLNTGYEDFYPSAMYKTGSIDSVYIAIERRFSPTYSALRVIATKWNPSPDFNTYYITGDAARYEKPCITIKQNNPVDSMMITTTKNNKAVYHFSPNGGGSWYVDSELDYYHGTNKIFTYCSSTPNGTYPFSAIFLSSDGDSIQSKDGALGGFISNGKLQVNVNNTASVTTAPVCVAVPLQNARMSCVIYAGDLNNNVYINQEGYWQIKVKAAIEGLYNPLTNKLNRSDTLRAYLYSVVSPNTIIDSSRAVIDSTDFTALFDFNIAEVSSYYLMVRSRNSIATFSSDMIHLINFPLVEYDFINNQGSSWDYNVKNVDTSPEMYALFSGDVNQDGTIDTQDLLLINNDINNFATGYIQTDLTGDNITDASDILIAYNNSVKFVSVKDPY